LIAIEPKYATLTGVFMANPQSDWQQIKIAFMTLL